MSFVSFMPAAASGSAFRQRHFRSRLIAGLFAQALVGSGLALAQTTQPLPYTMSTLAGLAPMSAVPGTQCPSLPAGVKSLDAFGDGCLAVNGIFGASARGGVQVDAFGNVFVADDTNSVIHVIDPTTGVMNVLAGGAASVCAAATGPGASGAADTSGDGCLAATQTKTPSQRGIGLDPWGNVLLGGYGDNAIHIVCRTASPNCTPAQIGTMQLAAGCVRNATSAPTGGAGLDNVKAAQTFITGGCTTANGEVSSPRGASGDLYGNLYFADTSSSRTRVVLGPLTSGYFTGTNPLYAALGVYYSSVTQGYAYSVVNLTGTTTTSGGTPTVKGASCAATTNGVTYAGTALDTFGDGCPFNLSSVAASSGFTASVAADAAGNLLFPDPTHGLRVLYVSGAAGAGALMRSAIMANNPGVTPQPGFLYLLWGGGSTALSAAPTLGTATAATESTIVKLAVSPQGNVYIGDNNQVVLFDLSTGFVRQLLASSANVPVGNFCSGSSGPRSLSAYSDGCPANQSVFSNGSGLGLSLDAGNNLYLFDASSTTKMLVRKVLAQGFAPATLNSAQTQRFEVHVNEPSAGTLSAAAVAPTGTDFTVAPPTCSAQYVDLSFDCLVAVTSTPSAPGPRSGTLVVQPSFTGTGATPQAVLSLATTVSGSALAFDSAALTSAGTTTALPPSTSTVFSAIKPEAVALDGAANVYAVDARTNTVLEFIAGTGVSTLPLTLPGTISQIAVDATGNLFAVGNGTSSIAELAIAGVSPSASQPFLYNSVNLAYAPLTGTAAPQAVAVDQAGNLFVADKQSSSTNTAIYRLSLKSSTEAQVTVATGFANPVSLAVDPSGSVFVADKDAAAVYKLTSGFINGVPAYVQTTVSGLAGVVPVSVATDAAGDLYVQDAASLSILEVPVTGPVTTVLTGLRQPSGLAVDGKGSVYSADAINTGVTAIARNAVAYDFGMNQAPTFTGTLTDVGNLAITGQNPVTNTTNFNVIGGASNGCNITSSVLGTQAAGNACTLAATFIGAGQGTVSDAITFLPAATTLGSLTLTGTLQGTAVATTTSVSKPTPALPSYSPSGVEVNFSVTVAASSGTPGGTVAVTVDATTTSYPLSNGIATVALSGLNAGAHAISAAYATSGSYTASNSGAPLSFTITQNPTTIRWTPAVNSRPYSAPVGTGVLNAVAIFNGAAVPGTFVYSANGSEINAASYLAVGTYTLAAVFYPADAVNYSGNSAGAGTLTITQAPTNAALGATQMVVAADGTGNYTSLQSALNALPNTGGSLYIAPGTYPGFITVVKPNISLYGLGNTANDVALTNEAGAFSPPFLPGQGYGNNGSAGDQGSATMVVARGTVNGFTGTPSNFYAENLTIANTYDTSTSTTTTNALVGGVCTANQPAQTLAVLYVAGTLCNSQALALWITGDQAVLNNVYTASQQDTIYAGAISGSSGYAARQYWFRGKITGNVDYIFGDAAAVFDRTSVYTTSRTTATIEAQNKAALTGSATDYLSGYVMNNDVFTSYGPGQTSLYFGRPYGKYSTWLMLNSYIDQVNPLGYSEFQGLTNLPTSTYAEYNDMPYNDPAPNTPDLNGVTYLGAGGNTGQGVTGTRETTSASPGTPMSSNAVKTSMTSVQAQAYYPIAFLGQTVPTSPYNSVTNWDPTAAIATNVNSFVPTGSSSTITAGQSVTIVMRPQTPGLGAVSNGVYTIPTGRYTLSDTYNGSTANLATGSLDSVGKATFTSQGLPAGVHTLAWIYAGDSNFVGSTSSTYALTVNGVSQTISFTGLPSTATFPGDGPFTLNGSASSGLPVSYSLSGPATVVGNVLTLTGTGTVTVTASQPGNATYSAAAAVAQTINVSAAQTAVQLITTANLAEAGGSYLLSVTVTNSGTAAVNAVMLTGATVGAAPGTPLPQALGSLAPGGSASVTLTVPASAGLPGTRLLERFTGTYSGGSFGASFRTTLP